MDIFNTHAGPWVALGLMEHYPRQPPAATVTVAYRRMSLAAHPDRPGGHHAAFVAVARAREILSSGTEVAMWAGFCRDEGIPSEFPDREADGSSASALTPQPGDVGRSEAGSDSQSAQLQPGAIEITDSESDIQLGQSDTDADIESRQSLSAADGRPAQSRPPNIDVSDPEERPRKRFRGNPRQESPADRPEPEVAEEQSAPYRADSGQDAGDGQPAQGGVFTFSAFARTSRNIPRTCPAEHILRPPQCMSLKDEAEAYVAKALASGVQRKEWVAVHGLAEFIFFGPITGMKLETRDLVICWLITEQQNLVAHQDGVYLRNARGCFEPIERSEGGFAVRPVTTKALQALAGVLLAENAYDPQKVFARILHADRAGESLMQYVQTAGRRSREDEKRTRGKAYDAPNHLKMFKMIEVAKSHFCSCARFQQVVSRCRATCCEPKPRSAGWLFDDCFVRASTYATDLARPEDRIYTQLRMKLFPSDADCQPGKTVEQHREFLDNVRAFHCYKNSEWAIARASAITLALEGEVVPHFLIEYASGSSSKGTMAAIDKTALGADMVTEMNYNALCDYDHFRRTAHKNARGCVVIIKEARADAAGKRNAGAASMDDSITKVFVEDSTLDAWEPREKVVKLSFGRLCKLMHLNPDAVPRLHRPSSAGTGMAAPEDLRRIVCGVLGHGELIDTGEPDREAGKFLRWTELELQQYTQSPVTGACYWQDMIAFMKQYTREQRARFLLSPNLISEELVNRGYAASRDLVADRLTMVRMMMGDNVGFGIGATDAEHSGREGEEQRSQAGNAGTQPVDANEVIRRRFIKSGPTQCSRARSHGVELDSAVAAGAVVQRANWHRGRQTFSGGFTYHPGYFYRRQTLAPPVLGKTGYVGAVWETIDVFGLRAHLAQADDRRPAEAAQLLEECVGNVHETRLEYYRLVATLPYGSRRKTTSASLQSVTREARGAACPGYLEADLANNDIRLLRDLVTKAAPECNFPQLELVCAGRDAYLASVVAELKCDFPTAKKTMLATMYARASPGCASLRAFAAECAQAAEVLCQARPMFYEQLRAECLTGARKKDPSGTIMSYVLGEATDATMSCFRQHCAANGIEINQEIFDGALVPAAARGALEGHVFEAATAEVAEKYGLGAKFVLKELARPPFWNRTLGRNAQRAIPACTSLRRSFDPDGFSCGWICLGGLFPAFEDKVRSIGSGDPASAGDMEQVPGVRFELEATPSSWTHSGSAQKFMYMQHSLEKPHWAGLCISAVGESGSRVVRIIDPAMRQDLEAAMDEICMAQLTDLVCSGIGYLFRVLDEVADAEARGASADRLLRGCSVDARDASSTISAISEPGCKNPAEEGLSTAAREEVTSFLKTLGSRRAATEPVWCPFCPYRSFAAKRRLETHVQNLHISQPRSTTSTKQWRIMTALWNADSYDCATKSLLGCVAFRDLSYVARSAGLLYKGASADSGSWEDERPQLSRISNWDRHLRLVLDSEPRFALTAAAAKHYRVTPNIYATDKWLTKLLAAAIAPSTKAAAKRVVEWLTSATLGPLRFLIPTEGDVFLDMVGSVAQSPVIVEAVARCRAAHDKRVISIDGHYKTLMSVVQQESHGARGGPTNLRRAAGEIHCVLTVNSKDGCLLAKPFFSECAENVVAALLEAVGSTGAECVRLLYTDSPYSADCDIVRSALPNLLCVAQDPIHVT